MHAVLRAHELCRKAFTATLAAGTDDLAATRGRFACEKSVPAGTNEIAGLKSPLHIVLDKLVWSTAPHIDMRLQPTNKKWATEKGGRAGARNYGIEWCESRCIAQNKWCMLKRFQGGIAQHGKGKCGFMGCAHI
ncbi:hypothetical protein MTsPCn3_07450 [Erythrobacter sp. MTPC3]